jgi:hypothetical protein
MLRGAAVTVRNSLELLGINLQHMQHEIAHSAASWALNSDVISISCSWLGN